MKTEWILKNSKEKIKNKDQNGKKLKNFFIIKLMFWMS